MNDDEWWWRWIDDELNTWSPSIDGLTKRCTKASICNIWEHSLPANISAQTSLFDYFAGVSECVCICICAFACKTEADVFGDDTHLRGMRGTAVGVEAAVATCSICSSADRPPPTWKATWSALLCRGKRQWEEEDAQRRRGNRVWPVWLTGWTGDLREWESLFLQQEQRIELWNKVIPGVSLFNLKSAHADSEQSSFNGGQMLCWL